MTMAKGGPVGNGVPACGDRSPDGAHACVFGFGHSCPYHSCYPHAWRRGEWVDPYTADGLARIMRDSGMATGAAPEQLKEKDGRGGNR